MSTLRYIQLESGPRSLYSWLSSSSRAPQPRMHSPHLKVIYPLPLQLRLLCLVSSNIRQVPLSSTGLLLLSPSWLSSGSLKVSGVSVLRSVEVACDSKTRSELPFLAATEDITRRSNEGRSLQIFLTCMYRTYCNQNCLAQVTLNDIAR